MTKKRAVAPSKKLVPADAVGEVVAPKAFEHLAEALGVYLGAMGWRVLVVGAPRVQQQPGEAKFNYEFVVRFTGGRKR